MKTLFALESDVGVPIISVLEELGSFADADLFKEWDALLGHITATTATTVIVDCNHVQYFGSSFLEALRRLWQLLEARSGRMLICELSPVAREILTVAHFDDLWPIYPTRSDALRSASMC